MPGLCGVEFAREVLKIRSDIPILMTSGVVRKEDAAAIRNLGLADLILKPNTVEELGKALDDLLKRNPANQKKCSDQFQELLVHERSLLPLALKLRQYLEEGSERGHGGLKCEQ